MIIRLRQLRILFFLGNDLLFPIYPAIPHIYIFILLSIAWVFLLSYLRYFLIYFYTYKYNLLKNLQAVFNSQLSVELNVEGKRLNTAGAYANKKGLLSIGSESGGGEAVNQKSYLNCYNGLRRILDYLNIYEANLSIKLLNNKTIYTKKSGKNGEINATCNGIFIPSVSLWDNVKEKQVIGHIVDIFKDTNEKNTIYANNYGIIVGIRNCSSVNENDTLFWIVQYVK